ncbi:ABC transporter permease [Brachybacterium sp. AOP43-C2-M15]|uniref:ABC transporter permease n=1 Tax=Brachybacterium sp. AOP43-C2-M15 TaxID=3457661 RepID=UPI004033A3BA
MRARILHNEFAKMRHLRIGLTATTMVVAIVALSLIAVLTSPDFDPGSLRAWYGLLAGMSFGVPLISPLLLAVLASRQVDLEHQGGGWLLQATSGISPGRVCRVKLLALGLVVTAATIAGSGIVLLLGVTLLGLGAPAPLGRWVVCTVCTLVVNLVVLALHVLLSARVENQLVALGVGVLGCIMAIFSQGLPPWAAHLTPWGHYALAQAAGYEGEVLRALPIDVPGIVVLGVVAAVLFAVLTHRFDRQEA